MIRIEKQAWDKMVAQARSAYPNECCGAMLGAVSGGEKTVKTVIEMENAFDGERHSRYELRSQDLLNADRQARRQGMDLVGVFHSHPDRDAHFSDTDLKNSCPWCSFLVLSIRNGEFDHANSFLPNAEQTGAETEDLTYPCSPAAPAQPRNSSQHPPARRDG